MNGLSSLLRLISRVACLIVLVWFALFVVDQASSASSQQQAAVNASAPPGSSTSTPPKTSSNRKSSVRRTIDDAAEAITSPFSGATAGSNNEWVVHGGRTLLALIVYGFGLGYLARVLRVRV